MIMAKKVFVAMSGGVDSSVAAAILKDKGYDVVGVNFLLFDGADSTDDAKKVCDHLGIELKILDLRETFKEEIINYFALEYENGRTPNPCVMCNKKIKFGAFYDFAMQNGADFIASGHYAKIEEVGGEYFLKKAENLAKDQSYVLYNLNQEILSKAMFPIAEFSKEEIRKIANDKKIPVANKPDSQDICFIPDGDYISFLKETCGLKDKEGIFVDDNGEKIGVHKGSFNFTIGQRKGLGVTFGKPMFVTEINAQKNEVTLSPAGGEYFKSLNAIDVNFISGSVPTGKISCLCKTRYSAKPVLAELIMTGENEASVIFSESVRAVTSGQSVAFYDEDILLGGGVIISAER